LNRLHVPWMTMTERVDADASKAKFCSPGAKCLSSRFRSPRLRGPGMAVLMAGF
jgi:hypothetical protein